MSKNLGIAVVFLLTVLFAPLVAGAPTLSLIPDGAPWKFLDSGRDPGTAWRAPDFDDHAWPSGPAQLGFGDGDEATTLAAGRITYYFRRRVVLTNAAVLSNLTARLLYDDGGVVYVNGAEAFRVGMPAGPVDVTTLAIASVNENALATTSLQPGLLVDGTNVIAVEIHQASLASSDVSFALELTANTAAPLLTNQPPFVIDAGEEPPLFFGYLRREVFTNISGMLVADLTNSPKFPALHDLVSLVGAFEAPSQFDDNYGQRLSGLLLPPVTGDYVFYLSSDDQGALLLSTDENPANKMQIAVEPAWSPPRHWVGNWSGRTNNENVSRPIRLQAGGRYYIEALHKEGGGGDSLGVAWKMPGAAEPVNGSSPISGEYLAAYASDWITNTIPKVTITATDPNATEGMVGTNQFDTATFTLRRTGPTNQPLTVPLMLSGTASNGVDYISLGGYGGNIDATIPAGASTTDIVIRPIDDSIPEETESVWLQVGVPPITRVYPPQPPAWVPGHPSQAEVFIRDNEFAPLVAGAPTISLIPDGAPWKFLDSGRDPGTAWRAPDFDDHAWPNGPAQLGFGDGDEATALAAGHITYYFRRSVVLTNAAALSDLTARLFYDDGAVLYVNGVEVFRVGMPVGPVEATTLAITMVNDNALAMTSLQPGLLVDGTNVIAVEIHQASLASSDVSFALELTAATTSPATNQPPFVQLNVPLEGAEFPALATIAMQAFAQDPEDGAPVAVEFFEGTNLLGSGRFVPSLCPAPYCPYFALTWSNVLPGDYVLTARATDSKGATGISAPVHVTVANSLSEPPLLSGSLRREVFTNILGMSVADLTNSPKFPALPDVVSLVSSFEAPSQFDDNYGQRLSGVLLPPVTGDYVFYLSSDDQGALFLSSDEDPAHKTQIAVEPAWSPPRQWVGSWSGRTNNENVSRPVRLQAGRRYYVEALHKEGGGGDSLGVAWKLPGAAEPANGSPPIPGEFLATYGPGVIINTNNVVTIVATDPDAAEGMVGTNQVNTGTFTLRRTGPTNQPLAVSLLFGGTAVNGLDYVSLGGFGGYTDATIPAGASSIDIVIRPIDDSIPEETETVVLQVGVPPVTRVYPPPPPAYYPGNPSQAEVFIRDNDVPTNRPPVVTVTSLADSGPGTLRDSIASAPSGATITFAVTGVITLTSGELRIDKALHIVGPGAPGLAIARSAAPGTPAFRIFEVRASDVSISALTIRNGLISTNDEYLDGAGIENRGSLLLRQCVVSDNNAVGGYNRGGGVCNRFGAELVALQSTVAPNACSGHDGEGGAIYNYGTLAVTNCTFSGNSVGMWGGAIHNDMMSGGTALESCTFTANSAQDGGGIFNRGSPPDHVSPVFLRNTIVVENTGGDISHCSLIKSGGYNLIGSITDPYGSLALPFVPGSGDRTNVTATAVRLGPLQDNGGPTPTCAPLRHSLALNAGPELGFPSTDQRGVARPLGGRCDIGAFESDDSFPNQAPILACPAPVEWRATTSSNATGTLTVMLSDTDGDDLVVLWTVDGAVARTNVVTGNGVGTAANVSQMFTLATGPHVVGVRAQDGLAASATCEVLVAVQAPAGPGSLDLTFDPTRGGDVVGPATEQGEVLALARQPDGKLVIGGRFSGYNGHLRRHIARLHPNGALDEGFDPGFGPDGEVHAVALQPDGHILVGGSFSVFDTQPCASLVRLNPEGSLDTGFNAAVGRYGTPGMVKAIVVQGDGKILIGGSFSEVNGVARTNVARLNPDGSLDAAFVPASGAPDWYQGVVSLDVLPDGKLLVGGRFLGERKLLCRLQPDGSLDSTFATELTGYGLIQAGVRRDGKIYAVGQFDIGRPGWNYSALLLLNADGTIDPEVVVDFDNTGFYCFTALAVQPDDRVLVSGWFHSVNGVRRNQVARLNPDGTLDESFDPGSTLGEWLLTDDAPSMVVEPDGHIWMGGYLPLANGSQTALVRLRPNGQLDEGFYTEAGEVSLAGDSSSIQALATLPDGRVYVGGVFASFNHQPRTNLARLLPDGTLDSRFNPAWSSQAAVSLLALQPDEKLLAGSSTDVVRFNLDGSLDPSFNAHLEENLGMRIGCLALQADGKIVLGGEFAGGLARLNSDGSLDATFEPPYLPAYDGDAVHAVAVQPDGKILLGGSAAIGLWRLLPNGSVDSSFSFDGHIGHRIQDILVQPDGTILIGGHSCIQIGEEHCGLVRLHPNGSVDSAFNALVGENVEALTLAPDGRILAAVQDISSGWQNRIRRLDSDGSVDLTFQTQLGPMYGQPLVADIVVQADGQVLIGGVFRSVNGVPMDGLARLNNDLIRLPPLITRHPASQTRFVGQTAVFSVEAAGSPPLSYQWRWNGHNVPGATNASFVIRHVSLSHGGGYTVVLASPEGAVTSAEATLKVMPVPTEPGSLDSTFDPTAGGERPGFGADCDPTVGVVLVQPDGKILAGGSFTSFNGAPCDGLARFNPDGSLEARHRFDWPATSSSVNALAIQPDGKILFTYQYGWNIGGQSSWNAGLARLNPDLSWDTTFNVASQWDYVFLNAVAVQPDGKILLGGVFSFAGEGAPYRCVARFHADGSLDSSFAPPPLYSDGEPRNAVNNIVVQPDGRIILLGGFDIPGFSSSGLARLWPDGSLDTNFARNVPWAWTETSGSLVLQPDGKLVVAAHFMGSPGVIRPNLLRLHPDGSVDASFQAPQMDYSVRTLARLPDGGFLVSTNQWPESGLVRLHQDGSLDESFQVQLGWSGAYVAAIAVQTNGQAIIGGQFDLVNGYPRPGLARLNTSAGRPWVTRELPAAGQSGYPCLVQLEAAPAAEVNAYAVEDQPPASWTVANVSHGGVFDARTGKVKFGPFFDHEPRTLSYVVWPSLGAQGAPSFTGMASADGVNSSIGGDQHLVLAGCHPAEVRQVRPADWMMTSEEVTAYASAWRQGLSWMVAPNPIPMDYVTRAAALWRGGECYRVDPSVTSAPLWWVNCAPPAAWLGSAASDRDFILSTAVSPLPPLFIPGEPITVCVNVSLTSNGQSYAVEDQPPTGWTVTAISHDGALDAMNNRVKWGPFLDGQPRTLSYEVTPSVGAGSLATFVGSASFDGSGMAISGSRQLRASSRLSASAELQQNRIVVCLRGQPGTRYMIETSTDLVQWVTADTVTCTTDRAQTILPASPSEAQRFYRARPLP